MSKYGVPNKLRLSEIQSRFDNHFSLQNLLFALLNKTLAFVISNEPQSKPIKFVPKSILLINAGHVGDVIISTGVLYALRKKYPEIEIGFLVASWAASVVSDHPLVTRVHVLDHWFLKRRRRYLQIFDFFNFTLFEQRNVANEIREHKYDLAIDLRAWFPNFIPTAWQAGIPIRLGYSRVGPKCLLTHSLTFKYERRHELEYQLDFLKLLSFSSNQLSKAKLSLAPIKHETKCKVANDLCKLDPYHVLHVCSSTPTRDWSISGWRSLAKHLIGQNITPVFTGKGARDFSVISNIVHEVPGCVNTCDNLSLDELIAAIEGAELVYSVETSVGHIAAALGKPVLSIYGGMADPQHWKPYGNSAILLTHEVPCSPCFLKHGCKSRDCLTKLNVNDVILAAEQAVTNKMP